MAELAPPDLVFEGNCPDCGERRIELPQPLPDVGDDFDWRTRDYDGFRLTMLQELAARFPERTRWTPADMEVVLVEVLSAVLDQLSDMLDRVAAEAYLETARRPESVRRLLSLIGYDAVHRAVTSNQISKAEGEDPTETAARLDRFWLRNPHFMEDARREGPRSIHVQHRMVTVDDYARRLEDHPLVLRAHAWSGWTGSWETLRVAVVAWDNRHLDGEEVATPEGDVRVPEPYPEDVREQIEEFHEELSLLMPPLDSTPPPSIRAVLRPYLEAYRMVGQEVVLENALPVPVTFSLSIRVASNFYRSEVRHAVNQALATGPGGFFEPGRLAFGEDLHAGDLIQAVMALDGVESVCLNRFQRLGSRMDDHRIVPESIELEGLELAVCDNDPAQPDRGFYRATLHGGLKG